MLVVLEGLDGAGKSTQIQLLEKFLTRTGRRVTSVKLPDYEDDSSLLVRQYLLGRFGDDPGAVNAYAAALFFAVDRYASYTCKWRAALEDGGMVLADRYTTSNAYHQGAKLPPEEWASFFGWLEDLEYEKLQLPRPDLVFFLDLPPDQTQTFLAQRAGSRDIHERSTAYQQTTYAAASAACSALGWVTIPCMEGNRVRSPEEVHGQIQSILMEHLTGPGAQVPSSET